MNRRALAAILAVALFGGIAGVWTGQQLQRAPAEQARKSALAIARRGSPMPTFSLPRVALPGAGSGGAATIASEDLRGRALLVNFWATWCKPCLEEMPALDALHRDIAGAGGAVVGIALDEGPAVSAFLERLPVSYPIALAEGLEGTRLARRFGNEGGLMPYSVFVDREGRIADVVFGELDEAEAAARMAPLLGVR